MSFLSIAFLAALPLIAAPLLLHLFDRRRRVEIGWGAMQFLVDAAAPRTSPRRLRQCLLLLLRTLAIAALILALARPMVSVGWLGNGGRTETVLVIDNSMSMTRGDTNGTLMQQAIGRTLDELGNLSPGDRVRLMTAAPYPMWHDAAGDHNIAGRTTADHVRNIAATQGRSDLLAALMTAVQADADPSCQRRRVVVLSDGQSGDWRAEDQLGWQRFRAALAGSKIPTELETIQLRHTGATRGNVSVDQLTAKANRVGTDQPVTLTAQLHARGATPPQTIRVHWEIDGQQVDSTSVQWVDQEAVHQVQWTATFPTSGPHRVRCRIEHQDDLPADNHASVVVEAVDQIPVLIVESDSQLAESQQDGFFVQVALGWFNDLPLDGHSVHTPTVVAPQQITDLQLARFHAVIIPNLTQLEPAAVTALTEYVSAGGGLWVGLGPRTDIDAFNQHWYAAGSALAPLAIERIVDHPLAAPDTADAASTATTINPLSSQHTATAALTDNQQLDLGDVRVDRRFEYASPPANQSTSVLLSLSNGKPLAVENLVGQGRVIVQAIPLKMQWSDLAQSQSFVVMVRDFLDYLSQPKGTQFNLDPGDPLVIRSPDDDRRSATLINPQGVPIELTADRDRDGWVFRTNRTSVPGDYQLEIGLAGNSMPFHVARDRQESDLTPLDAQQQKVLASLTGSRPTGDQRVTAGTAPTDPLWPYLLVALIGLITADLLLSGILARERFGTVGVIQGDPTRVAMVVDRTPVGSLMSTANGVRAGATRIASRSTTTVNPNERSSHASSRETAS